MQSSPLHIGRKGCPPIRFRMIDPNKRLSFVILVVKQFMYRTDSYENHVIARLFDFFASVNPWHRRLWEAGTVLTLKEVLEASEARNSSVLSEGSLNFLKSSVMPNAARDKGIGSKANLKSLEGLLKTELRYKGFDYLKLEVLARQVETDYLINWAAVLKNQPDCPAPERTARAIAAHLLDLNFHPDFLHRWLKYQVKHAPGTPSLPDIVAEAHNLTKKNPQTFEVYVPFDGPLTGIRNRPADCLDSAAFTAEFVKAGFNKSQIREHGGLRLFVPARDVFSSVEKAGEIVDAFNARITVGTHRRRPLAIHSKCWVKGETKSLPLHRAERGVEVDALERANQLLVDESSGIINAAIELLAPMAFSSPSAALAGGWAAVESLLGTPGDDRGINAGDRMATIIACSFPRAELTRLSFNVEEATVQAAQLKACATTHEAVVLFAEFIKNNDPLVFIDSSDKAALERMRGVIQDPITTLTDIETHLRRVFRRMYRLRNLILHWGKTDAVAARSCLRSVAPLVAEGMDRIVHSYFVDNVKPIELAAFARIKTETLDPDDVRGIVDLLSS